MVNKTIEELFRTVVKRIRESQAQECKETRKQDNHKRQIKFNQYLINVQSINTMLIAIKQ